MKRIEQSFDKLREYVEKEDYKGWDPYDGLNSKVFQSTFFRKSTLFRLCWIQLFKRNPINLRKLFLVKKDYNAKGVGLFLSGYCNLKKIEDVEDFNSITKKLTNILFEKENKDYSGSCWGYNFDWQARAFFQPANTPTVVASTFIANSLLDLYEINNNENLLKKARSTCDFILKDLNISKDSDGDICFSYSPLDNTQVFNASLLGARLLSRVYSYTKEDDLLKNASSAIRYVIKKQKSNGSWSYGTLPFHSWIDNFHTGYNLECIHECMKYTKTDEFNENIKTGMDYYLNTFFKEDGFSRYYSNKDYPLDIHAPAQLVSTLYKLDRFKENLSLIEQVLLYTINNMQEERGFFYYQKGKYISSKIPYMRWAQAWMFYALSLYKRGVNE